LVFSTAATLPPCGASPASEGNVTAAMAAAAKAMVLSLLSNMLVSSDK
jgi:hypothetical protein